jgi:cyclophilin family peptidyl-prolyl cis-trans isomerase
MRRASLQCARPWLLLPALLCLVGTVLCQAAVSHDASAAVVTDVVTLTVSIDGTSVGAIRLGLFGVVAPRTVANYVGLCSGTTTPSGEKVTYAGSPFHRVIKGFMIQTGDVKSGNGYGSTSIYGGPFDDEPFDVYHTSPGVLSMANSGPNTNGCQFFITCVPTPHLDGKHVVFGRVLTGMEVVRRVEDTPTGPGDRPIADVRIASCFVEEGTEAGQAGGDREAATLLDWEARVYGAGMHA